MTEAFKPQRPASLGPIESEVLDVLGRDARADALVIGGGIALKHYVDLRPTHDIDAWWSESSDPAALTAIEAALAAVAERHALTLRRRKTRAGEMHSFDLQQHGRTVFSFQVASRDIELAAPSRSSWGNLKLESLADTLGSKMTALVARGAPRDFLDVRAACDSGLSTVEAMWELWGKKNPGESSADAKREVLRHLAAIELRNPLSGVAPTDRDRLFETRRWFREVFAGASPLQGEEEKE
uniref:Protein containing DUF1814 n=1 Tax=mine drainage metagenome TaxID=410659 RepID=E6Q591_9ZZZZ